MSLLLGLDFGTGGVRVGVFDLDARRMLAEREAEYGTRHPKPGWAEQSPADWWEALGKASRAVMADLGRPEIAGICAATTASTVVACERNGIPLQPALLWMDCRAAAESDATARANHPVLAYSGGSDAAEWLVPKAMWLARHEPAVYARAGVICECLDWINFRLTGRWVGSRMNATCKWNWDSVAGRFHDDLFAELGVPDLAEKLPQPILPVGAPVERLSREVADHLGLSNRPVVAQGGIDAHIGMVGADTIEPGDLLMIGGTSVVHLFQLGAEQPVTGFWGPYPHALVDGRWLVEAGQVSAGSVLSWFSREIFALDQAGHDELCEAAGRIPVGGSGLLALDYFMGNRTPYRDPHLRGAVLGLSLGHDRAALYHAAVEGVALASANVLKRMDELGVPCRRIVTSGGYSRNPLWLKATVDAIGRPVELPSKANLTIIGACACAAAGAGLVPDLDAAAKAVVPPARPVEPDLAAHARYRELLEDYLEATELLAPLSRRLAARQTRGTPP
ncbi:FGGY-family carbohydrate kinase [Aureimonas leprariae]|uniref:Sugar kinase n=1 Tax=Plantimonas leprariae TaxID=2615207 RepID=A0A7V7PT41_9HYPH|nr:FGGY-family carbohydrate kinase [Aureimonas leprariae]KAB0682796.1 sugar kinase [Aureimonas leprariae]